MGLLQASDRNIVRAARALREGELVAFPTETVYGLGADAANARAIARLFELKGRPQFNPLIVHVTGVEAAQALGDFSLPALQLARAFWPGALTLVVPRLPDCPVADLATAGLATVALRAPSHELAQALLAESGVAVAAPSANRSGHVSPTSAAHVEADLGDAPAFILDGGAAPLGIESTVVDATGEELRLLRPGAVTREDIEAATGLVVAADEAADEAAPASPGRLESHYAPRAILRLNVVNPREAEAFLAFGPEAPETDGPSINLSPSGNLREAAAKLFSALRELDAGGAMTIAVMPIPEKGLGEAINDRLRRAASPHE